jgi:hypothetical protein
MPKMVKSPGEVYGTHVSHTSDKQTWHLMKINSIIKVMLFFVKYTFKLV